MRYEKLLNALVRAGETRTVHVHPKIFKEMVEDINKKFWDIRFTGSLNGFYYQNAIGKIEVKMKS